MERELRTIDSNLSFVAVFYGPNTQLIDKLQSGRTLRAGSPSWN